MLVCRKLVSDPPSRVSRRRLRYSAHAVTVFAAAVLGVSGCGDDDGGILTERGGASGKGGVAGAGSGGRSAGGGGTAPKGGAASKGGAPSAGSAGENAGGTGEAGSGEGGMGGDSIGDGDGDAGSGGEAPTTGGTDSGGTAGTGGVAGSEAGKGGTAGSSGASFGGSAGGGKGGTAGANAGGVSGGGTGTIGGAGAGGVSGGGGTAGSAGTAGNSGGTGGTGGALNEVILKYDFEDVTGTTVTDSSSSKNHGVLSNAVWSTVGRNSGGVGFAAPSSVVSVPPDQLADTHQLTVAAWVNLTSNIAENQLFYFGYAESSYLSFTLNNSNGGMSLRFRSLGGSEQVLTTPTQLPLNVWKHVAVTLSSAGTAIYVDGKVVMRNSALILDPASLGHTISDYVGNGYGGNRPLQGTIDEFYMYRRAFAPAEVAALAWPKSDYSIFHFDEGTGTTTADSSARAKHGTLFNATWVPGVSGGAVRLDNPVTPPASQYVDLADGIISDCGANLTTAGWMNLESNTNNNARFLDFGNDIDHYVYVTPRYDNENVLRFSLKNLAANNRASGSSFPWVISRWYHIAVVRQGMAVALYVDGVLLAGNPSLSTGFAVSSWGSTTQNYFGKSQDNTHAGLDASIDEILVSCRPYTADEIEQLAYIQ